MSLDPPRVPLLVALLLAPFAAVSSTVACVVGTGTSASCTEAAFDACMFSGPNFDGTVTFDCGAAETTIVLTGTKSILAETVIDGGTLNGAPKTVLSGGGTLPTMFGMTAAFTIRNLSIRSTTGSSGAITDETSGTVPLTVTNCTLFDNQRVITMGGPLTVTNSNISDNAGLAIVSGGNVTVHGSVIARNQGGIFGGARVTVTDSTFAGNHTGDVGGAINTTSFSLNVRSCTFHDNSTDGTGGAIRSGALTTSITNSTFVNNRAGNNFEGGAIAHTSSGPLTVTNCTFSINGADAGGAISTSAGAPVTLVNTILASIDDTCSGTITDGGHNIDRGTTCGFTGSGCATTTGTSFCNTDPLVGALADNGGPTETMALDENSPAGDAGDNAACAALPVGGVDQRGLVRPGVGATACSIGAYELNGAPCGDVNADGLVDIGDALITAQYDVLLRTCGEEPFSRPAACDVNKDEICDIGDTLRLAQCDVGLISCVFSCGPFACPSG